MSPLTGKLVFVEIDAPTAEHALQQALDSGLRGVVIGTIEPPAAAPLSEGALAPAPPTTSEPDAPPAPPVAVDPTPLTIVEPDAPPSVEADPTPPTPPADLA